MPKGVHNGDRRPKRTKEQRELDLIEMVRLLRRGWKKVEIAQRLGLDRSQITYDWKVILQRLEKNHQHDLPTYRNQLREEYAEVKREAWGAWELSKQAGVKVTEEETADARGLRTLKRTLTEGRLPDREYLDVLLHCLEAERELEGLDEPRKLDVRQQAVVATVDWDRLAQGFGPDEPDPIEATLAAIPALTQPSSCETGIDPAADDPLAEASVSVAAGEWTPPLLPNGLRELGNGEADGTPPAEGEAS